MNFFSYANYFYFYVLWLSVCLLVVFAFSSNKKSKIFLYGLSYGFGYNLGTLYWISNSFDVIDIPIIGTISLLIMSILLGIYKGIALLFSSYIHGSIVLKSVFFSIFWVIGEYIQGNISIFSFPWNYAAYVWNYLPIMQSARFIGIYGLSFTTMMFGIYFFLGRAKEKILSTSILTILLIIGNFRLSKNRSENSPQENCSINLINQNIKLNVRMIHPNISQKDKWDKNLIRKNFELCLNLSEKFEITQKQNTPINILIWPETAILYNLDDNLIQILKDYISKEGILITGAFRRTDKKTFNSAFSINKNGEIVDYYDKRTLVPFGEYIPFFEGQDILFLGNNLSKGNREVIFKYKNLSFLPLICYEIIFPVKTKKHYDCIINFTNDAWYKSDKWYRSNVGPFQHLHITRFRAICEEKPIIRNANSGISAVIDKFGQVISSIDSDKIGFVDFYLK